MRIKLLENEICICFNYFNCFLIWMFDISKRISFVHYCVCAIIAINAHQRVLLYNNDVIISKYKIHLKVFITATMS